MLDIHDPIPELYASKFSGWLGTRAIVRLLAWEERLATRAADLVLCVHEPHRALTVAHGADARKLRVVENLADGARYAARGSAPAPRGGVRGQGRDLGGWRCRRVLAPHARPARPNRPSRDPGRAVPSRSAPAALTTGRDRSGAD